MKRTSQRSTCRFLVFVCCVLLLLIESNAFCLRKCTEIVCSSRITRVLQAKGKPQSPMLIPILMPVLGWSTSLKESHDSLHDISEKNEKDGQRRHFLSNVAKMAVASQIVSCTFSANAESPYREEEQTNFITKSQDRKQKSQPKKTLDIRYFIAGAGCASFSHGIATPFDVVKTKIQADPRTYNSGLLSAASTIIDERGISVLLSGLGPTVLGFGVEGAIKFGVYETLKPQFMTIFSTDDQTIPFLAASVCAGAIASLFLCPLERVRIKMVTDTQFDTGLFSSLGSLIEQDGILALLKGFPAMLSKQVPYTVTKQLSFEMIAASLYELMSTSTVLPSTQFKFIVSSTSAFLASILACIASNPGDVILTRTYSKGDGKSNESLADVAVAIYEERGVEGIFSGLSARFWHVGLIVTSQLVIYDFLKQLLGLPATGA